MESSKANMNFRIILFAKVSQALEAERILKSEKIPFKLLPIPKAISPTCGTCLQFAADRESVILENLSGRVEIAGNFLIE